MTTKVVTDDGKRLQVADKIWDLHRRVREGLDPEPVLYGLQLLAEGKRVIEEPAGDISISGKPEKMKKGYDSRLQKMDQFYRSAFGRGIEMRGIALDPNPKSLPWTLAVPHWLTYELVEAKCYEMFDFSKWSPKRLSMLIDYDREVRTPEEGAYAIALRDRFEADYEYQDLSAKALSTNGIRGVTLMERLILEIWQFWRTGTHLDSNCLTLCHGSRFWTSSQGEYVPTVRFIEGSGVKVLWIDSNQSGPALRTRQSVLLT